jgi:hypothetical protein
MILKLGFDNISSVLPYPENHKVIYLSMILYKKSLLQLVLNVANHNPDRFLSPHLENA